IVGIQNLQSRSSEYVRSVMRRVVDGGSSHAGDGYRDRGAPLEEATAGKERTGVSAVRQPRAIYFLYWVLSIVYSAALVWLIVARLGDALMDWFGVIGALLTVALAFLVGQRLFRPTVRVLGGWGAHAVRMFLATIWRSAAMGTRLRWSESGAG